MFCPKCGFQNDEENNFCINCGSELFPKYNRCDSRSYKNREDYKETSFSTTLWMLLKWAFFILSAIIIVNEFIYFLGNNIKRNIPESKGKIINEIKTKEKALNKKSREIQYQTVDSNDTRNRVKVVEESNNAVNIKDKAIFVDDKNALEKAKMYADILNYSMIKIKEELEYAKFAPESVEYAMENLQITDKEIALEKAKMYANILNYSMTKIKEELKYAKFTPESVEYAMENLQITDKEIALEKAKMYANILNYSMTKIKEELEYAKFAPESIEYALTNLQKK